MSSKNFMSYGDAETLFSEIGSGIKAGIKTTHNRSANDLNNMLSYINDEPITSLTAAQLSALADGDVASVFPVGARIEVPASTLGGDYDENAKVWRYAGNIGSDMVFVFDAFYNDSPYYRIQNYSGYNLARTKQDIHKNYSASTVTAYKQNISLISAVIADQFNKFFGNDFMLDDSLQHIIPKAALASRVISASSQASNTALTQYVYISDSENPSFETYEASFAFIKSKNVFGRQVAANYIPKVLSKNTGLEVSASDMNEYQMSLAQDRVQFPIFKYADSALREAQTLVTSDCVFEECRLTLRTASSSNRVLIELFPELNERLCIDLETGTGQDQMFVPYVYVTPA